MQLLLCSHNPVVLLPASGRLHFELPHRAGPLLVGPLLAQVGSLGAAATIWVVPTKQG